jgi:hypothetical protein
LAIDIAELQHVLKAVQPSAVLVPGRILRRVVRIDRGLLWLDGAHPTSYVVDGAVLQAILDGTDLARPSPSAWPETTLLIAQPEPEDLAEKDRGRVLTELWRRLFHARVEHDVIAALEATEGDAALLETRIAAIGHTEFEEAQTVLRRDGFFTPPVTDRAAYAAFAAVFLELTYFDPSARSVVFPAIERVGLVESLLARDVDGKALLVATRPAGAPEQALPTSEHDEYASESGDEVISEPVSFAQELALGESGDLRLRRNRLIGQARAAVRLGNSVRAAILWTRLANRSRDKVDQAERAAARAALRTLAVRLRKALFVQKGEASRWVEALLPLLRRAAAEFWSPERRLLYDLQRVCVDHEREVFRLEPICWLLSLGRRPLKRPLPHLREVLMSKHLRSAARSLHRVRLSRDERARLEGLLRPGVRMAEEALRRRFRPWVDATLESEWVRPRNLPERVGYRKLVEEMVDPIVSRGFTTLSDLRDAASRGNLKLDDLTDPREFLRGDRLLKADRALAEVLDGVHRRGGVYLRWLQRFSALAFGTALGRVATCYLALPYGGSFVLLKGLEEIHDVAIGRFTGAELHLVSLGSILLIGTLAAGIINYPRFRRWVMAALRLLGRAIRFAIWEIPAHVYNHPLVRKLITSRLATVAWRCLLKPGLITAPCWPLLHAAGLPPIAANSLGVALFVAAILIMSTRWGRVLEELIIDSLSHAWHSLTIELVPGLFRAIMAAFDSALEWVEKLIYAVDEWLRFHEGQSRVTLVAKAVLAPIWGIVAYVVRVYLTLLVEPQINPIKHFPVVTVAAKIMLPFALTLTGILSAPLIPFLGVFIGRSIAAATVFFLPGFFGFLVWELRANWRLYEANRPESLGALLIGSHGETVARFLRPGFHSGTLPKRFARWRRARRAGRERAALKHRDALHHVEEAVRRLVKREFATLLRESRALGNWSIEPGSIHLATNRIRIELVVAAREFPSLWIDLEDRSGILAGGVSQPGWLERLNAAESLTLADAVAGLYKLSGVQLIHTPGAAVDAACFPSDGESPAKLPPDAVNFMAVPIKWRVWVEVWEGEAFRRLDRESPPWRDGALPRPAPPP